MMCAVGPVVDPLGAVAPLHFGQSAEHVERVHDSRFKCQISFPVRRFGKEESP